MTTILAPLEKIPAELRPALRDIEEGLREMYGSRMAGLILYGSYARGDFHEESDVDIMLLLNDDAIDTARERSKIIDSLFELDLKYGKYFSIKPVTTLKFETSNLMFYKNVKKDGLWLA